MARKKKTNEEAQQPENLDNSDDTFGLPEVDYEPLKRETPVEPVADVTPEPEPPVEEPAKVYVVEEVTAQVTEEPTQQEAPFQQDYEREQYRDQYSYEEEKPAAWPKVLAILLLLALVGAAVWYFAFKRPEMQAAEEKERRELLAIQEEARRKEADRLAEIRRQEEAAKQATAAETATPIEGTVETLSGRSGRYYVVVASSIDGDLIMDYAKKLSAKGVGSKIIPPFGKSKFHRLAIAEGDTYAAAQTTADGMKGGDYGDKVWVVKY